MSDLEQLIKDLDVAGRNAQAAAYKAIQVEAHNMKDEWRGIVRGARQLRGLEAAVGYDVHWKLRGLEVEVGYDQRGQGELGNIAEYGTSTQGPKRPATKQVLDHGADRLEKYLSTLDPL